MYFISTDAGRLVTLRRVGDPLVPRISPFEIVLSSDERRTLEALARKYTAPYRDVVRARLVLFAAAGWRNDQIAARLDLPTQHVTKWRKRFCEERLAGLTDRPRHLTAAAREPPGRRPRR